MTEKKITYSVLFLYAVSLFLLSWWVLNPIPLFYNLHYYYSLFVFAVVVFLQRKIIASKIQLFCVSMFMIHAVVFYFISFSTELQEKVLNNSKDFLLFWLFVFFTAQFIRQNHAEKTFLIVSQLISSFFINFCYITHFNGIAPIKFIGGFFGISGRVRFTFGLQATNRAAYLALASFILSYIVLNCCMEKFQKRTGILYKLYLWASMLVSVLVILSTVTRGALLAIIYFILISKSLVWFRRILQKCSPAIWAILFLLILGAYAAFVFQSEGRNANVVINYEVFKEYANPLTGLGFLPFSSFLTKSYGYDTWALDIYYLYILFSTGIVGFIMQMTALFAVLYGYLKMYLNGMMDRFTEYAFSLYILMLISGMSESNIVSPQSMYSYIYWIIFLLTLRSAKEKRRRI